MYKAQAPATRYGMYAATAVLVLGPIVEVIKGPQIIAEFTFWLGLYGWLAVAIVVGYLVHLGLWSFGMRAELKTSALQTPLNLEAKVSAGELPDWETADLPPPPPFNFRNVITVIGPGTILLATSFGSGEWLIGSAVTAQFGGFMLWVATASIILQAIMNTEFIRYTMYTGEPIYTGFMRTKPGPRYWAMIYTVLAFLQLGWPGWASAAATALTALLVGSMPGPEHAHLIKMFGVFWFLSTVVIVAFGAKIERTIEVVQWFFVTAILLFLITIGFAFTSPVTWGKVTTGFFKFGIIPPGIDWLKLGALVASAGAGGVVNGALSNWYRDKGYGMGGAVGYIPALIGGRKVSLTHEGKVFPLTPENKKRWNEWWKFVAVDQYGLWAIGCFLGIGLPALLTLQFIPPGVEFKNQFGIAVYQAQYLARDGGSFMWFITLLVSFWILYSTQLGITDVFVRIVTDIIWSSSPQARAWRGGDIRFVYYGVLSIFTLWGVYILLTDVKPLFFILLSANMAGLNFVYLGLHTLYVNRKFLPAELQAPLWREVVVLLAVVFFAFFFSNAVPDIIKQLSTGELT